MPNGGQLTVETKNIVVEGDGDPVFEGLRPGDYVQLSVSDTGLGMDAHVQQHAFEPFFTTKEPGKGTGLGLATIYGFVKQSGGHVDVQTAPGNGTTVRIFLPKLESAVSSATSSAVEKTAASPNGETVLVVEDDQNVRRVTAERVRVMGFKVIEAENGTVALGLLEDGRDVDIVFSDVVMPGGVSGYALARTIREKWPRLPVVLTSGFNPEMSASEGSAPAGVEVLMKPYSQSALEDALWRGLEQRKDLKPGSHLP